MPMFACPHCKKSTISLGQKYLAGKWLDVYCSACGGRGCQQPILLAVLYFFYVWDLMFFGYVAYLKQSWGYLAVTLIVFLLLDAVNFLIPLAAMKTKGAAHDVPKSS